MTPMARRKPCAITSIRSPTCKPKRARFPGTTASKARRNPMDESLRAQIETYKSHLNSLIQRGRSLRETLAPGAGSTFTLNASSEAGSPPENDHSSKSAIAATRAWQEDCGVTINQLSGGSKAHWLARSFSEAFLMRSAAGQAAEGAAPDEIVQRLIGVLERAIASLSGMDEGRIISASSQAPPAHRF